MSSETTNPTGTRRSLLASAAAGIAAAVAATISRPELVRATNGDAIVLGTSAAAPLDGIGANEATATTSIYTTSGVGLQAISEGTGLRGVSGTFVGVEGTSTSSVGILGTSGSGSAVVGTSSSGIGVRGFSNAANRAATAGLSGGGSTGVYGYSGPDASTPPAVPDKSGVYGLAVQDANARGVTGESTAGRGVNGIATSGTGVYGTGTAGEGVRGVSTSSNGTAGTTASGIASGVYGENTGGGFGTYGRSNSGVSAVGVFGESTAGTGVKANSSAGVAFEAQGRVRFSTAGLAPVAVGGKSKVITPLVDVSAASLILCTLETNQAGLSIGRVTKNTTADTFTVFLTQAVASGKTAKIAWFLIG
jgi:hypothetical protein